MNITDAMVERVAKAYVDALYDDIRTAGYKPEWSWETWEEEKRERERRRIRKALEAAFRGTDVRWVQELEEWVEELEQEAQGADKVLISIALRCKEAETRVKELESALRRLLNQFDSRRKWPKIAVRVTERWVVGAVDDECRDAIRYGEKVLEGGERDG